MLSTVDRTLVKRRARKVLVKLLTADEANGRPIEAKSQRSSAAAGLLRIVCYAHYGRETVAREFIKSKSRQAQIIRSLLKLSDDHLELLGPAAIYPDADSGAEYKQLLALLLAHSEEASFFWTIRAQLREGTEGPAAVLYLATAAPQQFFRQIRIHDSFNLCNGVIRLQEPLSLKWYCAVKLLCIIFKRRDPTIRRYPTALPSLLSIMLNSFINNVTKEKQTDVSITSQYQFVFRGVPILPLIAGCRERFQNDLRLEARSRPEPLKSFLELLIHFVCRSHPSPRRLSAEGGFAVCALTSFFKVPSVRQLFGEAELPSFASLLMDMMLHPWTVDRGADDFEEVRKTLFHYPIGNKTLSNCDQQDILKPLAAKEDLCLACLCFLPPSTFRGALSGALKEGMLRLNSPSPNPYEPLGLVERLLWLSNIRVKEEKIHRALVEGCACEFLGHALKYTGNLEPGDRGLWRAKGLTMTCLGNMIERMDKEQFCDCVQEEMVTSVVAIKEDGAVPLVQKGQAIFLLQRYTLAADRVGVQPFYREDTSNMAEEFRNADPDDTGSE